MMADIIETFADGTIVERNFTEAELAQIEADKATQLAKQAEAETKATARAALLTKLGITQEEAQLLLGGN
jgi:hypothetical protein